MHQCMIFQWNFTLPVEQSRRNQNPVKHRKGTHSAAAAEAWPKWNF